MEQSAVMSGWITRFIWQQWLFFTSLTQISELLPTGLENKRRERMEEEEKLTSGTQSG